MKSKKERRKRIREMKRAKEMQMMMRKGANVVALFLCIIICIGILAYTKANKPETIMAEVIQVEYNQGKTSMLAELPDGNIEWWDFDYCVYEIPKEIEIRVDNHEIYNF